MDMFKQAFSMFTPFARHGENPGEAEAPASSGNDLDELKRQLSEMQKKIDKLGNGEK